MAYGLNRVKSELEAFSRKRHCRVPRPSLMRSMRSGESFGTEIRTLTANMLRQGGRRSGAHRQVGYSAAMTMIYLEDLLADRSFAEAANGLSRRVRDAHDFPPLHQVGFVVPDVERAAKVLEDRGIGPFLIMAGHAAHWRERGELRDTGLKLGMAYHQGIQIELLEPVKNSGIHANSLHPSGKAVVEHLAFLVKDVDLWAEKLIAAGTDLFVRAQLKGLGLTADLAYMDKNEDDGLSMEFLNVKLFGIPLTLSASKVHPIGQIQKWTGKRCLEV